MPGTCEQPHLWSCSDVAGRPSLPLPDEYTWLTAARIASRSGAENDVKELDNGERGSLHGQTCRLDCHVHVTDNKTLIP